MGGRTRPSTGYKRVTHSRNQIQPLIPGPGSPVTDWVFLHLLSTSGRDCAFANGKSGLVSNYMYTRVYPLGDYLSSCEPPRHLHGTGNTHTWNFIRWHSDHRERSGEQRSANTGHGMKTRNPLYQTRHYPKTNEHWVKHNRKIEIKRPLR